MPRNNIERRQKMINKLLSDRAYDLITDWFIKVFALVIGLIILAEGIQYGSKAYVVIGAVMIIAGIVLKKGAFKNDL